MALLVAGGASAVHATPQFELEGDIADSAANPAPDWGSRFNASGASVVGASCSLSADDLAVGGLIDRTIFPSTNKNGDPVPTWQWGSGNTPVKDDLSNVYGCTAVAADGDVILYAGAERISANGASHIDYELFQDDVGLDGPIPCTGSCFFVGSRTIGDLIVSVDFEVGGTVGSVTLRRWDGSAYVIVSSSGLGCNAGDTICVFSNTATIASGPWATYDDHGDTTTTLPTNAFTEFGINLTELLAGNVPCTATALIKTRSSPSFASELKDFASASFRTCPSKSGTKFHDLNGNGVKDAGEPGLPGWTIRAYKDTNGNGTLDAAEAAAPAASDVTDASGNYAMTFQPGKYIVCEVLQAGWNQSFPTGSGASCAAGAGLAPRGWAIDLPGVIDDTGNDFGNYQQATKTGFKFHDLNANGVKDAGEPGLTGWTINAYLDANGNGTRDAGENTLSATTTTGAGGTYTLSLVPGKYIVCEVQQAGWTQSFPANTACGAGAGGWAISLTSGQIDSDNNFGNFRQATKTGVKFHDLNANSVKDVGEAGLPGWTIRAFRDTNGNGTLDAGETTVAATGVTGVGGVYTLTLAPGKYVVCETQQAGWIQSWPVNGACGVNAGGWGITLASGDVDSGNDFGNYQNATKSGVKFHDLNANGAKDGGEPGLSGWTINAYEDTNVNGVLDPTETTVAGTAVTGAGGAYSMSLRPGRYVVCEVQQATWTQSFPAGATCGAGAGGYGINLTSGQLDSDNDFGNYQRATKSGMKFHDQNTNGAKDAGEPGLSGWTINAYADANGNGVRDAGENTIGGTATTGTGGAYSMSLIPGNYVVCEVQQSGWTQSFPSGTACGAGAAGYGITLTSGQVDSDNDFGNFANVDANIQISPLQATNEVGSPHVFTAHVNVNSGSGFVNAPAGTTINLSILSGPGSLSAPSCTTIGTTGSCTVTLNSSTPGVTTVRASTTVVVMGQTVNRATGDGLAGDSGDAVKNWVDANIQISPLTATNALGDPHVFTGHVNVNSGTGGYVNAPSGTTINFNIVSGPGSLTPASCTTIGTTGSCTVTLNNASTPGQTTVRASTAVVVGGVTLNRATGDANAGDSPDAVKNWVDANIQISPLQANNALGSPHVFTGHVNVNSGTGGYVNAPSGTTINFNIVSGPGSLTPASCTTIGTTGSCTVTLNNASTPGQTTVRASTAVVVGGVTLNRATGDANAGDSPDAVKNWVDANIQISPLTDTNAVGDPHVFTGHVNVNSGSGFVNAPAGTTINFTIVSGPGSLTPASCTTVGTTGECSVTLNSAVAGQTTVRASTSVVVAGQTIDRATGDANAGDSPDAVKTWVDANIQISPLTATNEVGSPHVFTGHVNVNTGTGGYVNAPAGTTINFNIVSGPGSLTPASCTTIGTTGSCTVTLNNASTAGLTTVRASTAVVVGGLTLNRATGDGLAGDSANAVKTWVDANIQITPLTATNTVGDPHVFTGHVNVNTGTGGYVNAPAGTTINFTILSGPGSLSAPSCLTVGATGSCSVTLNNSTGPGQTTVRASTAVVVGGQTLNRATGDGLAGDSADAVKTWVGGLSGVKYHDLNANGIKDEGEPGLAGWTIRAYTDTNGNGTLDAGETTIVGSAVTGVGGTYSIGGLSPGDYVVCEVLQATWFQSAPANTKCAAIVGLGAGGYAVSLGQQGGLTDNLDFGNWTKAIKSGMKFEDVNNNGVKDPGEPGLAGWVIRAYVDTNGDGVLQAGESTISASATTGTGGTYSLSLNPGNYMVCEVAQGGFTQTAPANTKCAAIAGLAQGGWAVSLGSGQTEANNDFGNWRQPFIPPPACRSLTLNRNQAVIGRKLTVKATSRDQRGKRMPNEKVLVRGAGVNRSARTNANGVATLTLFPTKVGVMRFRVQGSARCTARIAVRGPFRPPLTGRNN